MLRSLWIAVMLTLGLGPARGDTVFYDGNALLANCQSTGGMPLADCNGFITGVADVISNQLVVDVNACIPEGATRRQVIDVAVDWIDRYPATRHLAAYKLVALALHEAFPCPP
jgi:hypothetical protein